MKFVIKKLALLSMCILLISAEEFQPNGSEGCDNPCQACQKTVYQLKFQSMADCGTGQCKNTCHRITQGWNSPYNIWEPFLKDIFGKCEICFRAGYCKITECEAQKENELKVISEVLNGAKLTAKVNEENGVKDEIICILNELINKIYFCIKFGISRSKFLSCNFD